MFLSGFFSLTALLFFMMMAMFFAFSVFHFILRTFPALKSEGITFTAVPHSMLSGKILPVLTLFDIQEARSPAKRTGFGKRIQKSRSYKFRAVGDIVQCFQHFPLRLECDHGRFFFIGHK
jgi:hypothetical protein